MPYVKHPKAKNESVVIGGVRYSFDGDGFAITDEVTARDQVFLDIVCCEVLDDLPAADGDIEVDVDLADLGLDVAELSLSDD
ncbi:hypothetical protein [Gordonia malaquae]|uniref:hypothetical protein n=1 Tax=Gordonia malaquae TaxID=410332 RepID=UPI0030FE8C3B